MTEQTDLYLDHAATSWPKPENVHRAVETYSRQIGAAYGRGGYRRAEETSRLVDQARHSLARLLGVSQPKRLAFTYSCTDSLNFVIHGLLRAGDHIVATTLEHNSVLRPLAQLHDLNALTYTLVEPNEEGQITAAAIEAAITDRTRLVCVTHASNVTGTLQDVSSIGTLCQQQDIFFLVDAAQSAGHVPMALSSMPVDFVAIPGHKGLLGPLGTGLLYLREGMEQHLLPYRLGGTGTQSEDLLPPNEMPARYEAGNLNVPGIVGLGAAAEHLLSVGVENVEKHLIELTQVAIQKLSEIPEVTIVSPLVSSAKNVGVISLVADGFEPDILSSILDESFGIQTRSGLHCAPKAHESLGTLTKGGTLRISFGESTTVSDIDRLCSSLKAICN